MHFRKSSGGALLLALVSIVALSSVAVSAVFATESKGEQGVYGYWKATDKKSGKTQSIFKLYDDGGKLAGKILKVFPPPGEKYNPVCSECEGDRKNQPKEGIVFFWNFMPDKKKPRKWVDGKILNPDDGKVYGGEAELSEDGSKLNVYGYIRILFKIGGTNVWTRPSAEELQSI